MKKSTSSIAFLLFGWNIAQCSDSNWHSPLSILSGNCINSHSQNVSEPIQKKKPTKNLSLTAVETSETFVKGKLSQPCKKNDKKKCSLLKVKKKKQYTTLHFGGNAIDSPTRFLGGTLVNIKENDNREPFYIDAWGNKQNFRDFRTRWRTWPFIWFNEDNQKIVYSFVKAWPTINQESGATVYKGKHTSSLETARKYVEELENKLDYEHKNYISLESPMFSDPESTIYVQGDIYDVPYTQSQNSLYTHFRKDLQAIEDLPYKNKLEKVIIELSEHNLPWYMLLEDSSERTGYWNWVKNIHNMLQYEGKVYFEIRPEVREMEGDNIEKIVKSEFEKREFSLEKVENFSPYSVNHIPNRRYSTTLFTFKKSSYLKLTKLFRIKGGLRV